jgi:RNA methyltransferase, TrmH family
LRGTMGAAFLMPIRRCGQLEPDLGHWYALEGGKQAQSLAEADLSEPLRILVGNEGHGWAGTPLPEAIRFLAIPTQDVESLNAAVAAGIACYEASRRRS